MRWYELIYVVLAAMVYTYFIGVHLPMWLHLSICFFVIGIGSYWWIPPIHKVVMKLYNKVFKK